MRLTEHPSHAGDIAHVPLGQVLVERVGILEHIVHVDDFAHVPLGQILVEIFGTTENVTHVGELRHIPVPDWSVQPCGAIARWRQSEAFVDNDFEIRSVLW